MFRKGNKGELVVATRGMCLAIAFETSLSVDWCLCGRERARENDNESVWVYEITINTCPQWGGGWVTVTDSWRECNDDKEKRCNRSQTFTPVLNNNNINKYKEEWIIDSTVRRRRRRRDERKQTQIYIREFKSKEEESGKTKKE